MNFAPPAPKPSADRAIGRDWLSALLLLAVVALVYGNALGASFQFDDFNVIVDNPRVHDLAHWWREQPAIRPLLKLSYTLNWLAAPEAFGFHLFNLVCHALNTLLVWRWARQNLPTDPAQAASTWTGAAPLAVALLFALHPAATEAVTYVSGRSLALMSTFYLAALVVHGAGRDQHRPGLCLLWSPLLFALALACRETALTLPPALLLLGWWRGRPWRDELAMLRGHGVVLALAALAAVAMPGYQRFFSWSLTTRDWGSQLLGQLAAHQYLIGHSLFGLANNIDPDLRVAADWTAALPVAGAGLAIMATAWLGRRRWPWLAFGLAWYALQLAPTNSLLPRFDLANDRHLYLALPGVALAIVAGLQRLRRPRPVLVLLAVAIAFCGWRSHARNEDYRDELALWRATVTASPDKARPWLNLGWARQQAGDLAGARDAYACALARGDRGQAAINLAVLEDRTGVESPAEAPVCRP